MMIDEIDKFIAHCEEVADQCEKECDWHKANYLENDCIEEKAKCGKEHRQLAEYLKDYKWLLERESCEDAINRDSAIKAVCGLCDKSTGIYEENPHIDVILEVLENLPSVKPVCKPISAEVNEGRKIVIDIPEDLWNKVNNTFPISDGYRLAKCVKNGTPLPKGHGRLVDMDEALYCLEEVNGEDAIWAIGLIDWACSKRVILDADKTESGEECTKKA